MDYGFTSIPFEDLRNRLFKSGLDIDCYKKMCEEIFPVSKVNLEVKEYSKTQKDNQLKLFEKLAKKCSEDLPKFNHDDLDWKDVVLEIIDSVKIPAKAFANIFGHVEEEKAIYPKIMSHLKKDYGSVYDTTTLRSNLVRFADFTAVKKNFIGQSRIVSLDAKTRSSAFDHFLNQARDFQAFSDEVYMIATPGLILEAGKKYGKVRGRATYAQKNVVDKLKEVGVGLYVLDRTSNEMRLIQEAEEGDTDKEAKNNALRELKLV